MATKKIDVGSIQGNFYGGLPYSATWNFNDGGSPSTLSISVVSADGKYPNIQKSDLTYTKRVTIRLGKFSFVGYLESYSIEKTPERKILNLEYVDISSDLDRYYVGLDKRHAKGTNMILVGSEQHPCRDDAKTSDKQDPCDPCPQSSADTACDEDRIALQLWDVSYSFNELFGKIPLPTGGTNGSTNVGFKAQYTGQLRSVLGSWCSDLGLSYYWDPFIGKLMFVNRSKVIEVPDNLEQTPNIIDYTYGATKKGTFSRGFCGYFGKQGEIKNYSCQPDLDERFISADPVRLDDLLDEDSQLTEGNKKFKEILVSLSRYGKPLRDAFTWFYGYGLKTPREASLFTYGPRGEDYKNVIQEMGNMKILNVLHPSIGTDMATFNSWTEAAFTPTEIKDIKASDASNAGKVNGFSASNPSWYFIVAEADSQLALKQYESDKRLASEFFGRYYYKNHPITMVRGHNSNSVTVEVPDGATGNWYEANSDVSTLPIFGFGHHANSKLGKIIKKSKEPPPPQDKKMNIVQSFILIDRPGKYIPDESQIDDYQSLFEWYEAYLPKMAGVDGRPEVLLKKYAEAKNNPNIKLFIVRQWKDFKVQITTTVHPLEPSEQKMKTVERGGQTVNLGYYGLLSNYCTKIVVGSGKFNDISKVDMVIYTPAMGSIYLKDMNNITFNAYTAMDREESRYTKVLPKIQYSYIIAPESTDVSSLDYHYKEIQESNSLKLLGKKCEQDKTILEDYAEKVGEGCAYTMADVKDKVSMKLPGIVPVMFGVDQALNSININITENGSYTSYVFEDKIIQPPSDNYKEQLLKDMAKPLTSLGTHRMSRDDVATIKGIDKMPTKK